MNVAIEMIPAYRLAYVRQVGPYGPANVQAMEKLKKWADEKSLLTHSAIIFGIPQDNPETTPPESCRYDACIAVSNDMIIDEATIGLSEFSGGQYAVCKVKHTAEDVRKAWAEIYQTIQNEGYQIDQKPMIERYTGEMLSVHYCEICVPITAG